MADTPGPIVGTVASLWRYPVKSMQGERVAASVLTERGLLGDRAYALVDAETGHVASAKHPRKWAALLECAAAYAEPPRPDQPLPPVQMTLADGEVVTTADPEGAAALSRLLGRSVTLVSAAPARARFEAFWPEVEGLVPLGRPIADDSGEALTAVPVGLASPRGTLFDLAVIHLVTTASLDRLQALYPSGAVDVRRFRPNVVIQSAADAAGFPENEWIGRTLTLGDDVRLRVSLPCPRCVMATLAQGDLPKDVGILRAVQQNRVDVGRFGTMGCLGVYAEVIHGGTLRVDDEIVLE